MWLRPTAAYGAAMNSDKPLVVAGVVAGPLFVITVAVESLTRPGYSVLRHPISSLALGDGGWTQAAAFRPIPSG